MFAKWMTHLFTIIFFKALCLNMGKHYLMAHILVIFKQILKWAILMCKYCRMFNKFITVSVYSKLTEQNKGLVQH